VAKAIIRKTWITLSGLTVILVGVVMLVVPGPGLLTIAAGLAILATEFAWAKKLTEPLRRHLDRAKTKLGDRKGR
jgi:uncharacterized protein (TIGR02611 family)